MRHLFSLAIAILPILACAVQAQERVPPPPPDPIAPGLESPSPNAIFVPPPLNSPSSTSTQLPLPAPIAVPGQSPNSLEPGPYPPSYPDPYLPPPYSRRRLILGDPVNNTSFWIGADALLWWTKSQPLSVPVITTGPASDGANAGALGMPNTVSLNGPLNHGVQGGLLLYLGGWFNPEHTIGLEGSLFFLGGRSAGFGTNDRSGTGSFVINEPVRGAPFVTQVSAPGLETGNVFVNASTRFSGGDINAIYSLYRSDGLSVKLLGGFRYLQLNETLGIEANSGLFTNTTYTDNLGNVLAFAPAGSTVAAIDQFLTRNQFYGGQLGAQVQYNSGRWYFSGTGKLAIGSTQETVTVAGNTYVYPVNGSPVALSGGNYATLQAGRYTANKFALAPTLQLDVGYQFTPFLRGTIGYNFMYLSNVVRPGNQIDNTYDGAAHPLVPMANSSFWTQGINLGLQFSF